MLVILMKNTIITANRLKSCRENENITLEQVGAFLGVHKSTVKRWESGETESISLSTIEKLSKYYKVSEAWLSGKDVPMKETIFPNPQITADTITFPVIGSIAAGYEHIAVENWSGETIEIPLSYLKGKRKEDFLVLSVDGDSMYPLYQNGDKVLILKQSSLNRSGDIGAILYDDEKATLKKIEYVPGENWLKLLPINPTYQPQIIRGEELEHCRVIGIPKLLIRNID